MTKQVRILLVDDHALFRAGLARLLADYPDLAVVGEAGSAVEALQRAEQCAPDIILMDIDMPDDDGVSATRQLMRRPGAARIIMLTMHTRESYALEAIRAGAYGYLLKDASAEELVGTIRVVAQGGAVISPRHARRILDEFAAHAEDTTVPARARGHEDLSAREAQVLALIAVGETSRSIAKQLFLSENTVKRHTSNIYQKLHVKHRSQAAAEAVRRGLVPSDLARVGPDPVEHNPNGL